MKLHKEDTHLFEPFVETLMNRAYGKGSKQRLTNRPASQNQSQAEIGERYLRYFQALYSFEKRIQLFNSINDVLFAFNTTMSKFVDTKETGIFFFNEDKTKLVPVADLTSQHTITVCFPLLLKPAN